MDRRTEILDGALHVLAEQGMRGLTHRAVDTAAGIPQGSTSYYFRSRSALVTGCVERILELDLQIEAMSVSAARADACELVDTLVDIAVSLVTTQRYRTLARYELSLAAMRDPQLQAALMRAGDTVRAFGAEMLQGLGAADAARSIEELLAMLDGLLFTMLVRGQEDPCTLAAQLRPSVERAVRAQLSARAVARDTMEP
jgi:DNA-binding transcriptional regulator YbjK